MESNNTIRTHLARHLAEKKALDPTYSLRRMGADLGQNPAALCQILQGRPVSAKLSLRLGEKMGLSPLVLKDLKKAPTKKSKSTKKITTAEYEREVLDLAHYEIVSEWHYFAIRSLARTEDFRSEAAWVAERLGITRTKAERAITRLKKLGLLKLDATGKLSSSDQGISTTDGIRNLALRKRHEANLEMARQALHRVPMEERDYTFVTMAIDPKRLPGARARVRRFLNNLCDYLEGGAQTEVYEACIQLFPRSQTRKIYKEKLQ